MNGMRWVPRRIPISRWYLRSIGLGIVGLALLCFLLKPVERFTAYAPFLFAVRVVDAEGSPLEGRSVLVSRHGRPRFEGRYFGEIDPDGYVYGVLPMPYRGVKTLIGLTLQSSPSGRADMYLEEKEGWRFLGTAKGFSIPEGLNPDASGSLGKQLDRLPPWAATVEILHATIEL